MFYMLHVHVKSSTDTEQKCVYRSIETLTKQNKKSTADRGDKGKRGDIFTLS